MHHFFCHVRALLSSEHQTPTLFSVFLRGSMVFSISSLFTILCWYTFGSLKLATPVFEQFHPFPPCSPSQSPSGWTGGDYARLLSNFSSWTQVWALGGPLNNMIIKLLFRYLVSLLRVIVLLKDEPASQSEVKSVLEQVFIQDDSVHWGIHHFLSAD